MLAKILGCVHVYVYIHPKILAMMQVYTFTYLCSYRYSHPRKRYEVDMLPF